MLQIEDDAQVNQASDELRSSDMDDVVSPSSFASQESHTQVQCALFRCKTGSSNSA
jgi:hypothetical protein